MPIGPAVWQILKTFECLTPNPPPPKCPLVSRGAICLAYVHSQMDLQMCAKCGANRSSRLAASQTFEFVTPYPPCPWGIEGRLVFIVCPFPDESASVNQSWRKSDNFPTLLNCWPPKTPKCPLVSRGAICLAYVHSPMNVYMCAKFGANRPSRMVAFPEYVLRLFRLFAAVRADSRKHTPQNNIYT